MKTKIKNWLADFQFCNIRQDKVQLFCLVFVCAIAAFGMICGYAVYGETVTILTAYMNLAATFFFALAIRHPMDGLTKKTIFAGILFFLWLIILQFTDYIHFSETMYHGPRFVINTFLCEYLMLLPFALVRDEGEKITGVKIMGGCYIFACIMLMLLAGAFFLGKTPAIFSRYIQWFGLRLELNWNSNLVARVFFLGIGFTMIFVAGTSKIWVKICLMALMMGEFTIFVLANSRTVIAIMGLLIAGIFFFWIYTRNIERITWKSIALAAVCAVSIIFLSIVILHMVFFAYLPKQVEMSPDMQKYIERFIEHRKSLQNIITFGSRTEIWEAVWKAICAHPSALLTGVQDIKSFISVYLTEPMVHAHNAWLQVLLKLGIPGLLFSLWLTYRAFRDSLSLLFLRKSSMQQKIVCLLVLSMLGTELLEPYLFYTEYPTGFYNMAFLMCLGYMIYWKPRTEKIVWKNK